MGEKPENRGGRGKNALRKPGPFARVLSVKNYTDVKILHPQTGKTEIRHPASP